jgi:hypothetical protein
MRQRANRSDWSFGPAFNCLSGEPGYRFAPSIKQDQLITMSLGASCNDKLGARTGLFEANNECLVRHVRGERIFTRHLLAQRG